MDVNLALLNAGDTFDVGNTEYIVLEQLNNNQTAVIRKQLLEGYMEFDFEDNNWKTSRIREFLNGEYLGKIGQAFGKDRIVEHAVDLLSLDGLDDYGTSTDKVSLLTIDQYRKYRKELGRDLSGQWWLVTPDSPCSKLLDSYVLCVRPNGSIDYEYCNWDACGVRPFFIIQS